MKRETTSMEGRTSPPGKSEREILEIEQLSNPTRLQNQKPKFLPIAEAHREAKKKILSPNKVKDKLSISKI